VSSFLDQFKDQNIIHIGDSDLDGISTSILSLYYVKPICKNLIQLNTGDRTMSEINNDIFNIESDIFLFTDIVPTIEFTEEILKRNKKLIVIDHHETSKEILSGLDLNKHKYYYSEDVCATKLFYNLITENLRKNRVIDKFVHLVDVYDCWRDNHDDWEDAKNLHYLRIKSIDWRNDADKSDNIKNFYFIESILNKFKNNKKFFYRYDELKKISSKRQKENKDYKEAKRKLKKRVDSEGNKYIYLECPASISIIGNRLLKENKDVKYALCRSTYYEAIENKSFSLRANDDFNVRRIAELYGGGGHESSSGFTAKDDQEYNDLISGNKHPI